MMRTVSRKEAARASSTGFRLFGGRVIQSLESSPTPPPKIVVGDSQVRRLFARVTLIVRAASALYKTSDRSDPLQFHRESPVVFRSLERCRPLPPIWPHRVRQLCAWEVHEECRLRARVRA